MKANGLDLSEESQRELAAGVLKQAAQDLRRFRDATSKVERELYLDAHRWLTIDECSSPFFISGRFSHDPVCPAGMLRQETWSFTTAYSRAEFVCDDKTGKNRRKIGKFRCAT